MFSSRNISTIRGKFEDERSLAFDGSDDYVDCGTNFETNLFNAPFSVSVWVKPADVTPDAYEYIIGSKQGNDYFHLRFSPGGQLDTIFKEGTTESTNVEPGWGTQGKWHHIVSTLSDSKQIMYLDSNEVHSTTTSLTLSGYDQDTNRNLFIGGRNNAGTPDAPFAGHISDVAFYNTFLSATQVREIYNMREAYDHKRGLFAGNLLAWYRMGDGKENGLGTKIYDEALGSNDGTMTNMAIDDHSDGPL